MEPAVIKLISSFFVGPDSVAYIIPSLFHAKPVGFLCPNVNTYDLSNGLSDGNVPSSFNRRIFPVSELRFCDSSEESDTEPVPTYNFPSGPNLITPPLLNAEPGILSRIVIISEALFSFSVIRIILFHNFSFSSYV